MIFRRILIVSVKKLSNMKPFFSIIIATYNSEAFLERTLDSIISQEFENYEIIIVDGLSNDNTMLIVEKYKNHIKAMISEKDYGIYDAWNKGIGLSKGEWIMFVGSDDLLCSNALKNYWEFVSGSPLIFDYVSARVQLIDVSQNILRTIGRPWSWKIFKKFMCVAHVGSIHNRSLYETVGFYDISYKVTGDYELLLRAGNQLKTGFFKIVTAQMQVGGVSLGPKVFQETFRAKVETGNRNVLLAQIELFKAKFIFKTRILLGK